MKYNPLKIVLLLSRVVGMAPFAPSTRLSRALNIYSRLLVISIDLIVISFLIADLRNQKCALSIAHIFKLCGHILKSIINIIGCLTASRRTKRIFRFTKVLDQIDMKLNGHQLIDYKDKSSILFLVLLLTNMIFQFFIRLIYMDADKDSTCTFALPLVLSGLFNLMSILLSLQGMFLAKRFLFTLVLVNDNLQNLASDDNYYGASPLVNFAIIPKPAWEERQSRTQRTTSRLDIYNRSIDFDLLKARTAYSVRQLAKSYLSMMGMIRRTVEADEPLLLFLLIDFVLKIEFIFLIIFGKMNNGIEKFWSVLITQIWNCTICTGIIIFHIEWCHRIHDETERTHNLLNQLKSCTREEVVKNELNMFIHFVTLNRVTYSPFDMCTINKSLLLKIFGCVVTYLLAILDYESEYQHLKTQ